MPPRTPSPPPTRLVTWEQAWPLIRDVLLFLFGAAGIGWMLIHGPVNAALIPVFVACMGLPLFIRKDSS